MFDDDETKAIYFIVLCLFCVIKTKNSVLLNVVVGVLCEVIV